MKNTIIKLFVGCTLLSSSFVASAQTIFDVEIVFFKRIGEMHITGQKEPIPLDNEESEEASLTKYTLSEIESLLPEGYKVLNRKEQKLEGVYRRLKSSSDMRPVMHVGWRQELKDKEVTPWLTFRIKDEPEVSGLQEFEGIVRLSRNQGLVFESQIVGFKELPVDIKPLNNGLVNSDEYSDEGYASNEHNVEQSSIEPENTNAQQLDLPFNQTSNDDAKDKPSINDFKQTPDQLSGFFEMSETIKVKLEKLYYIDHPTMGLLVKVTPYQASIEEQEALN